MSMYGKYPKVLVDGELVEQNGLNGAPKAWPVTDCSGDYLLTVQAPRDEVDINKIVKRIEKGMIVPGVQETGSYMDVSEFDGLEDARIKVQRANEEFMALPASVRERFDNDPVELVEFLADEANRDEAVELGLVKPKVKASESETVLPAAGKVKASESETVPPAAGGSAQ